MPTVFLAEDHAIVREGLRALIENEPDLQVVGEAGDGLETLRQVEQVHPDVLIVDLVLPGLNGLEVLRRARKADARIVTIVLSMHDNEDYIAKAFRNGAMGYVQKDAGAQDLVEAIRTTLSGRRFLNASLRNKIGEAWDVGDLNTIEDRYDALTEREREILQLVAEGYTSGEIAEKLFISPRTADTHRANIMAKLNLKSQTDLVHFVVQRGLIQARPRQRSS